MLSLASELEIPLCLDREVHASFYQGLKSAHKKCQYKRYLHLDLKKLEFQLNTLPMDGLIVTEGIFSMSGQIAPLDTIVKRAKPFQYLLMVDEAHHLVF